MLAGPSASARPTIHARYCETSPKRVARLFRDQRRRAPPLALARRLRASSFGKLRTTLSYVEGSLGP